MTAPMEIDCPQFSSVIPITIVRPRKRPEVCASGVMLRLKTSEVLFTAAHVLDLGTEGTLCAPCGERFDPLHGYIWKNPLLGHDRENDPVDVGCVVLPRRVHAPATFRHLKLAEIDPDHAKGMNAYTIVGYPFRKTAYWRSAIDTEQQRFSGSGLGDEELKKHGLDPEMHIAIRFRRRKAQHGKSGVRQIAPHPRAMSGGGIFLWPRGPRGLTKNPKRFQLVGLFHTYDEKRALMIGTRIEYAIAGLRLSLGERQKTASGRLSASESESPTSPPSG